MKTLKSLLALCLLAMLVGCGNDKLPKNPPLTEEEPLFLMRIQPDEIHLDEISKDFQSLLKYFSDNEEMDELIKEMREHTFLSGDDGLFPPEWSTILKKLKKNGVKDVFLVCEKDVMRGNDNTPFFAFNLSGLDKAKTDSVKKAVENLQCELSKDDDWEVSFCEGGGYLVSNLKNSNDDEYEKGIEKLEDKISNDMLEKWPEDVRKGLMQYKDCAFSAVGVFPSEFFKGMQLGLELVEENQKDADDYVKAARKTMKNLKNVSYYAAGIDCQKKTFSISFFMENEEDASDLKENALKTVTESLKLAKKQGDFDVDVKDIKKFIDSFDLQQKGNVVTLTISESWIKDQKSFANKWVPKKDSKSKTKAARDEEAVADFEEDDFEDEDFHGEAAEVPADEASAY